MNTPCPAEPDAGTGEVSIPEDAVWVKCFDASTGAYYYLHSGTQESVWELPASDDLGDGERGNAIFA